MLFGHSQFKGHDKDGNNFYEKNTVIKSRTYSKYCKQKFSKATLQKLSFSFSMTEYEFPVGCLILISSAEEFRYPSVQLTIYLYITRYEWNSENIRILKWLYINLIDIEIVRKIKLY